MIPSRLTRARWASVLIVALAGATTLAACSSSSGGSTATTGGTSSASAGGVATLPQQYGTVPVAGADTGKAGTITFGNIASAAPTWIFPITPGADGSVYTAYWFQQEMWRPVYWYFNGVHPQEDPVLSLANEPVWSNNNQTVTFTMKSTYKWSDGQPITSADALMWFYVIKAALKENPANWGPYSPALGIPDEVKSVSAPDSSTVVMNMTKPVNPTWFTENYLGTGAMTPLPVHVWAKASASGPILDPSVPANAKKIWDYLSAQSKAVSTYASNPLWQTVDGPYKLTSFNATTGDYAFAPNPTYGGPHAKVVSAFKVDSFASQTAEWNAIKSGSLDVLEVPSQFTPQIPSVLGQYNAFGYPVFSFNYLVYNFKDTTNGFDKIIGQLYIRQAIAHLQDQKGIIRAFFHGAAGEAYGPVPAIPSTPFTPSNATTNPYPYDVSAAVSLLKAHGWTVNPGGTDTCSSPGSGPSNCGAGIPAGAKLEWNLIYNSDSKVTVELVQNLASTARQAGITMDLASSNFNTMINQYNDPSTPKNDNKWATQDFGGFTDSVYPTQIGVFNTPGSFNTGGYSDPQADALMNASVSGTDPNAVKNEAQYLTQQQPGLFQPLEDRIYVWSKSISGPVDSVQTLTQFMLLPEEWYFVK